MRAILILFLAALPHGSAFAQTAGLDALHALKIESGAIQFLERDDSPSVTIRNRTLQNVPPRTILKIVLNPSARSNIRVEIWLPDADKWNGRLIGFGNGGPAGSIDEGILCGNCSQGFAAAHTDLGTAPVPKAGMGNPEVWKDFGYRATHLMTVVAKQAVEAYYGKAPEFSYFVGGSTGGQQAIQEAQRFPEDYDGIVANIPALCRTPLHAYFLWNDQILKKCPFTPGQMANIQQAGIDYMAPRQVPALAGKCIADPRCTGKDIDAVIQLARQKDPSLTDAQAEALHKLLDGPRYSVTGERIFWGIPIGGSISASHGNLWLVSWAFAGGKSTDEINFGDDMVTYTRLMAPYVNAEDPNLGPFEKHGGKLIMVAGAADSIVPPQSVIDYYERVIAHFGDLDKVRSFCRFYLIPGMGHGAQATGFGLPGDTFKKVMEWREHGTVPNEVVCRRVVGGKVEMEMPVYPYPQQTGWNPKTNQYQPVDGPRGGLDPIANRFLPAPSM
ncbi:MAG TPA: tannase/feruloyl esterase family alpha/beta hydrolase [Chthoniobacteraceae bacterium]|nr:tannase/feruloyl esterase family alpha/beta hydrolase [Chthoniobacteraceae bacterium]